MSQERWGYDFDGVLAEQPRAAAIAWGKMNGPQREQRRVALLAHYAQCAPLWPAHRERFAVISARKETPEVRSASEMWLWRHYKSRPTCLRLLSVARRLDAVVAFKVREALALGLTDFAEDNRQVVAGMRSALGRAAGRCRIWLYVGGQLYE